MFFNFHFTKSLNLLFLMFLALSCQNDSKTNLDNLKEKSEHNLQKESDFINPVEIIDVESDEPSSYPELLCKYKIFTYANSFSKIMIEYYCDIYTKKPLFIFNIYIEERDKENDKTMILYFDKEEGNLNLLKYMHINLSNFNLYHITEISYKKQKINYNLLTLDEESTTKSSKEPIEIKYIWDTYHKDFLCLNL